MRTSSALHGSACNASSTAMRDHLLRCPEAFARRAPYRYSIGSRYQKCQVACDRLEVGEPQLDADRPADVVLPAQILRRTSLQFSPGNLLRCGIGRPKMNFTSPPCFIAWALARLGSRAVLFS